MPTSLLTVQKPPRTPRQHDRVACILRVARQSFAENSFHEVLMDDVAKKAGVGKGTIYRYFPDKESLYFAVIFNDVSDLKQQIQFTLPSQGNAEDAIRGLIILLISFFRQNRFFFRLMNIEDSKVGGGSNPNRRRWHQERSQLIDAVAQMLERARDTDALEIVHPRADAQILLGMVRSVLRHNEENLSVQQMSDEIARIYLHGTQRR
jgi:AcrR family transcriptional regulator